jgi:NAD(P)-dependent dehydrogenase (short-subunit alcohol dehydrogenase family)
MGRVAQVCCADLSDLAAVAVLGNELRARGVDGVVHAAGITHRADAASFGDEAFARVLRVNLEAPFALSRELVKGGGCDAPSSHVFIGSLGSSIGIPRAVAYVASKAGLLGVVRTLAAEWATLGVRVNAISPGYFRTELTAELLDQPDELARIESRIPMGRLGLPEELGGAAVFLLSDAASYVTGQQIIVDGGWLAT